MNEFLQGFHGYLISSPLLAYAAVFIGGVLTSFEPCIYTMLPVTVAFIGSQSGGSRLKGFFLSLVYVSGIAFMYSMLGALAALTGSLFGEISSKPWVNLLMGNLCIILGLSMFDLFMIRMPSFITNLQAKRVGRGGFLTIFFLGLFSGLVIGPCTAAVLGVTLAYVATTRHILFGVSLLFTFSMGMGVIIIVIGTFAGMLLALPKAGPWMEKVRKFMGAVLIILGERFIYIAGKNSL
jgi:cytochrome c-type biogenesis protein